MNRPAVPDWFGKLYETRTEGEIQARWAKWKAETDPLQSYQGSFYEPEIKPNTTSLGESGTVANFPLPGEVRGQSGKLLMRKFEGGATRNTDENKLDYEGFLSPLVLQEYAKYLHSHRLQADGVLRASDNWQNGIPKGVYFKSMLRHVMEAWTLHRQPVEKHLPQFQRSAAKEALITALMAVCFNAFGYAFELLRKDNDELSS